MSIGGTRAESVSRFLLQWRRHLRDSMHFMGVAPSSEQPAYCR